MAWIRWISWFSCAAKSPHIFPVRALDVEISRQDLIRLHLLLGLQLDPPFFREVLQSRDDPLPIRPAIALKNPRHDRHRSRSSWCGTRSEAAWTNALLSPSNLSMMSEGGDRYLNAYSSNRVYLGVMMPSMSRYTSKSLQRQHPDVQLIRQSNQPDFPRPILLVLDRCEAAC